MAKIIRLTESDLARIVNRVIKEDISREEMVGIIKPLMALDKHLSKTLYDFKKKQLDFYREVESSVGLDEREYMEKLEELKSLSQTLEGIFAAFTENLNRIG